MSSVTINWVESTPADADGVNFGAGAIRSIQTALRTGLAQEHVWPSSTGLAGGHARGSARVFVGPLSQVSSADTDGRLMFESTNSRLWYVGSEGTILLSGRAYAEVVAPAVLPAANHWALSAFTVSVSATSTSVQCPGNVGSTTAFITATVQGSTNTASNAYATVRLAAGNLPVVDAWNAGGSVYSGTTVTVNVLALSLES